MPPGTGEHALHKTLIKSGQNLPHRADRVRVSVARADKGHRQRVPAPVPVRPYMCGLEAPAWLRADRAEP